MLLLISAVLGILPLLGVVWIATQAWLQTVDGLFMSLILLTISGIFFLNVALEAKQFRSRKAAKFTTAQTGKSGPQAMAAVAAGAPVETRVERGRVERVDFFETHVGFADKSVVILRDGRNSTRTLTFDEDLRNALPVGKRVEIVYRAHGDHNDILDISYLSIPFGKAA